MPLDQLELGRRIKAAREMCGKNQEWVAEQLGLSRPTVTQIELGNRAVSSIELQQLADMFGRDIREFFRETFVQEDALAALFRAHPQANKKDFVEPEIKKHLAIARELASLENLLDIQHPFGPPPSYELSPPESRWNAIVQGRAAAEQERTRLELGNSPAGDLVEIFSAQGIYAGFSKLPDEISGLTLNDSSAGSVVIVNSDRRHVEERKRFSLAHELCHVLLDRKRIAMISRREEASELVEVRANAFAAAFLMPETGVLRFLAGLGKGLASRMSAEVFSEAQPIAARSRTEPQSQDLKGYDVALVAEHFGVSMQAMLYQLQNLRIISEEERVLLLVEADDAKRRLFTERHTPSIPKVDTE